MVLEPRKLGLLMGFSAPRLLMLVRMRLHVARL
jgi:hypothetical protein